MPTGAVAVHLQFTWPRYGFGKPGEKISLVSPIRKLSEKSQPANCEVTLEESKSSKFKTKTLTAAESEGLLIAINEISMLISICETHAPRTHNSTLENMVSLGQSYSPDNTGL